MSIKGFHHVAIKAEDFDRAYSFYTELLGLRRVNAWNEPAGRAVMLATEDDSRIELFEGGKKAEHPDNYGIIHMAFRTDDPDKYINAVRVAGYEVTMVPTDVCPPSDTNESFNARIAFCKGPCDELIEFFHMK